MNNSCCNMNSKQMVALILGLTFGLWLFYVGIAKWIFVGPGDFINWIVTDFSKVTWLPTWTILITAWIILVAEPLLGLMLVASRGNCRLTWLLTIALMFMLIMGKTFLQDHATVANIWQYLALCLVGLFFAEKACCLCKVGSCATSDCSKGECSEKPSSAKGGCCSTDSQKDSCCS